MQVRPTLLQESGEAGGKGWIVGGVIVVLLVLLISPFASGFPDGLEWVAAEQGFLDTAMNAPFQLLPGYTIPVLGDTAVSTIVAGLAGAALVAFIVIGLTRLVKKD
jgi:hypothetical protein